MDRHHALTAIGPFAPSLPSKQLVDVRESKGFSFVFFRNFKVKSDPAYAFNLSSHYVKKERRKEGKTKAVSEELRDSLSQPVSQPDGLWRRIGSRL